MYIQYWPLKVINQYDEACLHGKSGYDTISLSSFPYIQYIPEPILPTKYRPYYTLPCYWEKLK